MKNKKNVPDIRFKRFAEEWNNEALGKLAAFSKGRGYSKGDLVEKGTPIVLYGRLYTKYQTVISDVDAFAIQKKDSVLSKGIEVVVPASGETAEDISRASAIIRPNIIIAGDLNIIYPNSEMDSVFLALSISNGDAQKNLSKKAQGKSVVHLHNSDLDGIELKYPVVDEQKAIGSYFQNIDRLIITSQTKLDKLKNIKKACLEKMFPRNGSTTPELRFKGFSEEWEEKEMSIVAIFNPKSELPEVFEYVDLESVVGTEMISHREESKLTAPSRAQRLAKQGDLFYQTVRPYQRNNHLFDKDIDNYVFSTGYAQLRPYGNGYFLLSLVQGELFVKTVLDNCTGTSYPAISSTDLAKIKVSIPKYDEQKTIGSLFKNLDILIAKTEQQINKLKNIKKACLDKMFVNTEDKI